MNVFNDLDQLLAAKRLDEIHLQAHVDEIVLAPLIGVSGEHDDRHMPHMAILVTRGEFFKDRIAIFVGHHEIEQNEVGCPLANKLQTLHAAEGGEKFITGFFEVMPAKLVHVRIVVDQQHAPFGAPVACCSCLVSRAGGILFVELRKSAIRLILCSKARQIDFSKIGLTRRMLALWEVLDEMRHSFHLGEVEYVPSGRPQDESSITVETISCRKDKYNATPLRHGRPDITSVVSII